MFLLNPNPAVPTSVAPYELTVDMCHAVNGAVAARRPLLVRGEPGTGKSELARAVAVALGWGYHRFVVDVQVEARDLLYTTDPVRRLAEAQLLGHLGTDEKELRAALDISRFTMPGPLWWGFNWKSAQEQCDTVDHRVSVSPDSGDPAKGVVVLIDEIDKADVSVPNGLLEALGEGEFCVPGFTDCVKFPEDRPPLILLTTNEERTLPDAFLRRCFVLHLRLPEEEKALKAFLTSRARTHFSEREICDKVVEAAVNLLVQHRAAVRGRGQVPPGQAELLDLLRAIHVLAEGDTERQQLLLPALCTFVVDKQSKD